MLGAQCMSGSAAALRAAQHGLTVAWIRGDAGTTRASRARYVFNVDNMIGVSGGIVRRKALQLLSGPEHAAAREALARTHFHVGIPEIVEDVTLRLTGDFADVATLLDEKAVAARREDAGFVVETDRGQRLRHVLVDDATSETSVRGLFAVGDMSRHRGGTPSLKQIFTAQEYAVRAVQAIDRRERTARRARVLEGR